MFGRKQTTALEYRPLPVNQPVSDMAALQEDDLCMFTANDGRVALVARVRYITRDGQPVFELVRSYDAHMGESTYTPFVPGKTWRFVGAYRAA